MRNTFYITTPIYYVNDVPHIGHAYTTVAADVLARHYRQQGYDVFFLTGVDEHGQKVQQAAAKAGIDPRIYCDNMVPRFQDVWKRLNISHDAFIRTTDPQHREIVKHYLNDLYKNQLIYSADYTGWYCTFDERFWTEKDVVEGHCPDCKRPVERLSEKNYFFKMGQYRDKLERHIVHHCNPPDPYIAPQTRCNEVLGFLRNPLEDLSISRPKSRLSWGIELPFDPEYVTYVWFDALVNYISALHYLTPESKDDPTGSFERYWAPQRSGPPGFEDHKIIHLVGKDILTTHAVYWSTMLMALGISLPTTIFAHGWWTVNGEKMSKSRGNVVDPNLMAKEFGTDAFRYFLMREVPFGQDGDFSEDALANRMNSELSDGLGNLLSRTLAMIEKYCEGKIPEPHETVSTSDESTVTTSLGENTAIAKEHIEQLRFSRALEAIWESLQYCDRYIEKNAPWKLAKNVADRPKVYRVLYNVARSLECVLPYIYPFMPDTAYEMARQLGLNPKMEHKRFVLEQLRPGTMITKDRPLFPRIEPPRTQGESRVTDQPSVQPTAVTPPESTAAPQPPQPTPAAVPQITIDDFQKIQLKTATVLAAERVPRSEKLLKLQVDLGTEQRQIVAGIGKKYEPEGLVGRRIVIVSNLKPAKLMGIESQGMVLAAGDKDVEGLVTLIEEVPPGTKVK